MTTLHQPPRREGFTLVELLVAIAVLALLVAAVGQIIATASKVTTTSNKHIDADGQARMVFDRMADDFSRMIKRNDVDYIFCKGAGNDTLYFFSEGASFYSSKSSGFAPQYKDSISVVGYRINNGSNGNATAGTLPYGSLERLGKALSWDSVHSGTPAAWSSFLTYPPAGTTPTITPLSATYSSADAASTIYGAYNAASSAANGNGSSSLVGTPSNNFQDSADQSYHVVASNVFRFEYTFQLKDGTQSALPVMTPNTINGLPTSFLTATTPPGATDDAAGDDPASGGLKFSIGSRWYDKTNKIGYLCLDATSNYAVWHEIGIQDISAVVVDLAVIDSQGLVYLQQTGIDPVTTLGAQFKDGTDSSIAGTWTAAITPSSSSKSAVAQATNMPQSMVSQIRVYQRFFYINNQ